MRHIEGRCHCGNISIEFKRPGDEPKIPVRACGCSFCRKHGGVWTSHPEGELIVRIRDAGHLQRYEFGTATAQFHVCTSCGVPLCVVSSIEGNDYAVVNVNTFENVDPDELDSSPTDFDGETVDDRLQRRARNWIPNVTMLIAEP